MAVITFYRRFSYSNRNGSFGNEFSKIETQSIPLPYLTSRRNSIPKSEYLESFASWDTRIESLNVWGLTNERRPAAKPKEYRKLFWRWEERRKVWFCKELEYFRSRPTERDLWQIQQPCENLKENLKYPEASKMGNRCAVWRPVS